MIIKWTFFVLDFDGTYSNEVESGKGIPPLVYLIPEPLQHKVCEIGRTVTEKFFETESDECMGDIFEGLLEENKITYYLIGSIPLDFEDRQVDYLADDILKVIV